MSSKLVRSDIAKLGDYPTEIRLCWSMPWTSLQTKIVYLLVERPESTWDPADVLLMGLRDTCNFYTQSDLQHAYA